MADILLDTNIFRRVMENRVSVVEEIDKLARNNQFYVYDLTLFEIFDFLERNPSNQETMHSLLKDFLSKNNVKLIYHNESLAYNYYKNNISISTAKNLLFGVFQKRMVEMCVSILGTYLLALANSLDTTYSSEFYNYIRNLYQTDFSSKAEEELSRIIKECYKKDSNKKFADEFDKCVVNLMLGELTYFELSKRTSYTEEDFSAAMKVNAKKYASKKAREILEMYVSDKTFFDTLDNSNNDKYTNIFLRNYTKELVFEKRQFKINDMVDALNFKTCINEHLVYLSLDKSSLKKYEKYYNNDSIVLELIAKSRSLSDPALKLLSP